MVDGTEAIFRILMWILDTIISVLHIFSPKFRNLYWDCTYVAALLFFVCTVIYAVYSGFDKTSCWILGAGSAGLLLALYFRWSYDTPGIDVGNLTVTETRSQKSKYDY